MQWGFSILSSPEERFDGLWFVCLHAVHLRELNLSSACCMENIFVSCGVSCFSSVVSTPVEVYGFLLLCSPCTLVLLCVDHWKKQNSNSYQECWCMCYRSLRKYISFFLRQGLFNKYQEKTREHLEKWSGGWKDVPLLILVHNRLTHPWESAGNYITIVHTRSTY